MARLKVAPDKLRKAAQEFSKAGKESSEAMKRLDAVVQDLEAQWSGVTQQVFYKNYKEWRQGVSGLAVLLGGISREMNAMADRFETIDKKD